MLCFCKDFFRGQVVEKINMRGLDRVLMACLEDGKIHLRHYCIRRKKATTPGGAKVNESMRSATLSPRA